MSMRARFGKFVTSLNNSIINFIASLFSIRQYQQLPLAWCGFSASRLLSWMERSAQLTACHKQVLRLSSSCLGLSQTPTACPYHVPSLLTAHFYSLLLMPQDASLSQKLIKLQTIFLKHICIIFKHSGVSKLTAILTSN